MYGDNPPTISTYQKMLEERGLTEVYKQKMKLQSPNTGMSKVAKKLRHEGWSKFKRLKNYD